MPDYSRIITVINRIENEFPVDRLVYKGYRIWPLVRFEIASQYFWQKPAAMESNRAVFEREREAALAIDEKQRANARVLTTKMRRLIRDEMSRRWSNVVQADIALLTIGFEYTFINGKYYNRFFDPLKDMLQGMGISCHDFLTGFQGNLYRDTFSEKMTIAGELALVQGVMSELVNSHPDSELISFFDDLLDYLEQGGIAVTIQHGNLVNRLEAILSQTLLFETLLEQVKPRLAFVVCYYHETALAYMLACHNKKISVVDMQHSVVCSDDWGWAKWHVPSGGYELLPDYFWAWGESYADITRKWAGATAPNLVPIVGGNLWIPAWQRIFDTPDNKKANPSAQKTILYAAPFGDVKMFQEIFPAEVMEAIKCSDSSIKWLIRIHYKSDDNLMAEIRSYLSEHAKNIEVHRSSDIQLYQLFGAVDYHVSQTCTTVIEAEEFDVPNIIIGVEGSKWYYEEIKNGYYFFAPTSAALLDIILQGRQPIKRPYRLLNTDLFTAQDAVSVLLNNTLNAKQNQRDLVTNMPHIFTIETTLACNLRCPECAIGGGMIERTKAMMGFDQFKIIADKIRPYAEYVYLHIWGEPMLNPDIFRMIRYTAEFAKTNISTNGKNMTQEMAEELILSGVSDILVSIDGVTQAVYEQYRVGGNVEQAFNALYLLVQANVRHGNKTAITPQFVVFQHNQHEMEQFQTICASLGLVPSFKAPYIRNDDSRFACSDFPQFCRPHYSDIPTLQNAMKECQNPRDVFTILVDGSVVVCCHDYAGTTCFGNIFQQEIPEIWGSSSFCRFRDAIFSGNAPKFCQENCMTWFLDKQPASSAATADAAQLSGAPPAMISSKYMINLCCGPIRLPGYVNIDQMPDSDLALDLERELLPFSDGSAETVVCISAINYFSYERGAQIIKDVYRVLAPGGIARFASQDLKLLARKYLDRDRDFYFQKLPNGRDRFPGVTFADKLNEFFYGFYSAEKHCKYVYDYESLAKLFEEAGFTLVEQKGFMESRIPGVDRIDNRPEQMFFLEAVKGGEKSTKNLPAYSTPQPVTASDENFRDLASAAWHNNEPERAWQYLLKALALNPGDRQAMFWCSEILISMDRFLDVCKLYTEYLKVQPNDIEIREMLDKYSSPQCQKDNAELDSIELRQRELVLLNQRTNTIMTDQEHLAASVQWLRKAQEINGRGGVSAVYYMDEARWGVDYPETTGYIIPTFLHYASLTGDDRYRQWAIEMGEWELAIQSPEGGAGEPLGVYGLRPRVFNTGQVLLGWLSLYQATADSKYLNAAREGADWILSCLSPEGAWVHSTYQGPHAYKSRVSWALLELFSVTHEDRYRNGAELSLQWILKQARPNGWFENNSLSEPDKPWTHLIGYVLVGLLEILRIGTARIDYDNLLKLLHNAAKGIIATYRERKKIYINPCAMPATFDPNWGSQDTWSCVTGNAQLEFFLRRLSYFVADPSLTEVADQVMNDLKQIHLIDGVHDANLYGGIQGSVPIEAPYAIYSIPNWGVKFFADSLLQRLLPFDKIPYLS